MKTHNEAFGLTIRELRTAKRLTQEQLAFESGLSRTYISLLELGDRSPTLDSIMILCDALNIRPPTLFARVEALIRSDVPKDNVTS